MAIQRDPSKEGQPVDGTLRVDPRSRALGRQWREPVTLSVFFHFLVATTRDLCKLFPAILIWLVRIVQSAAAFASEWLVIHNAVTTGTHDTSTPMSLTIVLEYKHQHSLS